MTPLPHERPATGPAAERAAQMAALVPVIDTERMRLRAPCITDFGAYAEIACGPRGTGIGGPMGRDDAWADFMQITGTWFLRGHGGWTLEDRETRDVLGFVLIGFEPGDREPELGYMLRASAEGRGLAFEACRAVRDHAFGALELPGIVSYVHHGNDRSIRLAKRLGAVRDTTAEADLAPGDRAYVFRHQPQEARP